MGRRIDVAGLAKTAAGSVRDGMKLVIFASKFKSYVAAISMKLQRYRDRIRGVVSAIEWSFGRTEQHQSD